MQANEYDGNDDDYDTITLEEYRRYRGDTTKKVEEGSTEETPAE